MKILSIIMFCLWIGLSCQARDKANLTIYAPVFSPLDTLELYIWDDMVSLPWKNPYRTLKASNVDGIFRFEVDGLDTRSWISLNLQFQKLAGRPIHNILEYYLMEPKDDVSIYLSPRLGKVRSLPKGYDSYAPVLTENWDIRFEGTGAAKYRALRDIVTNGYTKNMTMILASMDENVLNKKIVLQYILQEQALKILDRYSKTLSLDIYYIMKGQILGKFRNEIGRTLEELRYFARRDQEKLSVQEDLDLYFDALYDDISASKNLLAYSPYYIEYLVQYYWLAFTEQSEGKGGVADWYRYCKEVMEPSLLRDRVLTSLLMRRFQEAPKQKIMDDALRIITDPYCLARLEPLIHHVSGKQAFTFSLPDAEGKYYSLEDFRGKVVFMDFWYAACIPCRKYMTEVVSPVKQRYKNDPNVVFVTVSTDELGTFQKMLERQDFLPKGGVHLYTDNMRYSHPVINYYQIGAYPFPLLLGRDGRLINGSGSLRDIEGLSSAIAKALSE